MSTQAEYSDGDKLYGVDMDNLVEALSNDGILTGWTLAQNATPNMSVDVAVGTGFIGGVYNTTVSTTNVVITDSHASLDRLDIIVVNNAGTISAIAGTPAASPNPPDLPDDNIALAIIVVDATVTAIYDADIISRRLLVGGIKDQHLDGSAAIAWSKISKTGSDLDHLETKSHTVLSAIGSNTHPEIDSHIADISDPHGSTMAVTVQVTTPKIYHGTNILIETPGDLLLKPSGKIFAQDDFVLEGNLLKNDTQITVQSTTGSTVELIVETDSVIDGGISPSIAEKGGVGGTRAFFEVRACNLSDVCSEIPIPKRALETLDSMMLEEIGSKIRDEPDKHVLKSEKLPKFLREKEVKVGRGHMRNVSATISFLQGCAYELLQENKRLRAQMDINGEAIDRLQNK